jgi:hypothetical protein
MWFFAPNTRRKERFKGFLSDAGIGHDSHTDSGLAFSKTLDIWLLTIPRRVRTTHAFFGRRFVLADRQGAVL